MAETAGYPIDLRRPEQIARKQKSPTGDFEYAAGRIVARLTGERVVLQDDGSRNRMVDIRIDYDGREPGYVEVTTDIDGGYAGMWSWLMRGGRIPHERPAPGLLRIWAVVVSGATHTQTRALEAELEGLLGGLERAGAVFERVATLEVLRRYEHPAVRRLLQLGVIELSSAPSPLVGLIRMYPAGIVGPRIPSWDMVIDWIENTLAGPALSDVRAKLADTLAPERHVFLGVSYTSPGSVFFPLQNDERSLPPRPPRLPPQITHFWITTTSIDRCIAWFPVKGWFDTRDNWATE